MIPRAFFLALVLAGATPAFAQHDAASRGAYLVGAAGCEACHTDAEHGGAPFAGGRVLQTEYGPIVTPNLTPDRDTGLGRWTERDFTAAMRWGIAPDDSHYVPVFPFPFYGRLTDRDLADIRAFLTSLKPVPNPAKTGGGGLGIWPRARNAVALALAPAAKPWGPDPHKDAVWNRGAYLVAGIGRCEDCHTPRNRLGLPDETRFLAGTRAGADGKPVPNITSDRDSGIGNWSEDDLVQVLTDGHTPSFDEVGGRMAEIVRSTARMTEDDRRAIAVFLQTVPPISTPKGK